MKEKMPAEFVVWVEARRRHKLSHCQIQMARELGLNPKKFGGMDNHRQEPWKAPLGVFIEELYLKRFRREQPERILTVEEMFKEKLKKAAANKELKRLNKIVETKKET